MNQNTSYTYTSYSKNYFKLKSQCLVGTLISVVVSVNIVTQLQITSLVCVVKRLRNVSQFSSISSTIVF